MQPIEAPLPLTLPITRPDVAAWLFAIPEDQRCQQAEQALAVGHQVLTLIQASASDAAMQQFFRPVLNKLGQLDSSLQAMLASVNKSQRLGDIGECMVQSQLRATFPKDQFNVISDTGHQADVLATFDLGGGHVREALVEVKLYGGDVPAAELEKFRRDLSEQRQLQASRQLRGDAIEQAWSRLQVELSELDKTVTEVGKLREAAVRLRNSMQDGLDELVAQVIPRNGARPWPT